MFGALHVALGALVLSIGSPEVRPVENVLSVETREACSGLSEAECCGQMLELAGFRAQGDHLPRLIRGGIKLACGDADREVSPQVCRSLLMTRGFSGPEADRACGPAKGACAGNGDCQQCMQDLRKLDYDGAHHACHAVTFRPKQRSGTVTVKKVFVIGKNGKVDTELRFGTRSESKE